MGEITIYTTALCPYCHRAKRLLDQKTATYKEIDVGDNYKLREELRIKTGGRTSVPQIWIGDLHIGGCDDLYALEHTGKLDALLFS